MVTARDGTTDRDGPTAADGPLVSDPAELLRTAGMLQALLVELHELELDDAGRARLLDIQRQATRSVREVVSGDLGDELDELGLPLRDDAATSTELRLAHAQLVGWINGLFQGIQLALLSQQQGPTPRGAAPVAPLGAAAPARSAVGQYL